jgi:hypothetical protein
VGAYLAFGWPVAAVVGMILLGWLLESVIRWLWRRYVGRRGSGYVPPLEEALRSGSRGFALMVFAALAAGAAHLRFEDWRKLAGFIPAAAQTWLLLACGAAFVLGAVWCKAGVARSAGARDPEKRFYAAVRLAAGGVALGYLARFDLPTLIGRPLREALALVDLPARFAPVGRCVTGRCLRRDTDRAGPDAGRRGFPNRARHRPAPLSIAPETRRGRDISADRGFFRGATRAAIAGYRSG